MGTYIYLESSLFWIPVLVGTVFLLAGSLLKTFPPSDINGLYGYRTARSMKNQESWDFGQNECSKQMIRFGKIGIVFGFIGLFNPFGDRWDFYFGLIWILISCGSLIYFVEKSLIQKFGR